MAVESAHTMSPSTDFYHPVLFHETRFEVIVRVVMYVVRGSCGKEGCRSNAWPYPKMGSVSTRISLPPPLAEDVVRATMPLDRAVGVKPPWMSHSSSASSGASKPCQ